MYAFISILVLLIFAVGLIRIYWQNSLRPRLVGWLGEVEVKGKLSKLPEDYTTYNNLYIFNEEGKTVQIDHLVVSKFGIFVIETKNLDGWVFGSDHNPIWTLQKYKGKTRFHSPIRQNHSHVKALQFLFYGLDVKMIPVVCFTNRAEIKTHFQDNIVINVSDLLKVVRYYCDEVIDDRTMSLVKEKIQTSSIPVTGKVKRAHIKQIKRSL